jgi:hypothetical protein
VQRSRKEKDSPEAVSCYFHKRSKNLLWSLWELNPRPLACHASALPTELKPRETAELMLGLQTSGPVCGCKSYHAKDAVSIEFSCTEREIRQLITAPLAFDVDGGIENGKHLDASFRHQNSMFPLCGSGQIAGNGSPIVIPQVVIVAA